LDGDHYLVKVGDKELKYDRVTNYTSKPLEVKDENQALFNYSSKLGREAENVIRDLFANKKVKFSDYPDLSNFVSEDMFKGFAKDVRKLKKDFKARGETIYSRDIKVKDDTLEMAGEVNLITKTKDGKYKLYDIRTIRDNYFYDDKIFNLDRDK